METNILRPNIDDSTALALTIESMKVFLPAFNIEYANLIVKLLFEQVSKQETLAVLNPSYNPNKNKLLIKQAQALKALIQTIELLKECDELKKKISIDDETLKTINSLFI